MNKISTPQNMAALFIVVSALLATILLVKSPYWPWANTEQAGPTDVALAIRHDKTDESINAKPTLSPDKKQALPVTPHSVNQDQNANPFSKIEIAEISDWKRKRGIVISEDDIYYSYSKETLQKLADGNDMVAAMVLASKLKTIEERVQAYKRAALLGSASALVNLGVGLANLDYDHACARYQKGTPEQRNCSINQFAYAKAAGLRGDLTGYLFQLTSSPSKDLNITPEESAEITRHAKEILANLEQERIQLGLGPFDNTIPPAVEKDNAFLYGIYMKDKGIKPAW